MCWCFAIINNKLAEIYFDKNKKETTKFKGHCYIQRKEFPARGLPHCKAGWSASGGKTKTEQKQIDQDIAKYRFSYRKGRYRRVEKK